MFILIFTFFNSHDLVVNSSLVLVICSCLINRPITFSGLEQQAEFSRNNSSFFYMVSAGFIHVAAFSWWLAAWSSVILFICLGRDGADSRLGYLRSSPQGLVLHLAYQESMNRFFTWWLGPKRAKVEAMYDFLKHFCYIPWPEQVPRLT